MTTNDKYKAARQLEKAARPLDRQVGGDHYRNFAIQPIEFIQSNNLPFLEGCIIKRICRYRAKAGREDLEKIKHEVDLLIAHHYPESDDDKANDSR